MGCFSMYELLRTGQKLHFWFSKLVPETVTDLQTICACAGMWPIRVVYGADGPVLSTTEKQLYSITVSDVAPCRLGRCIT